MHCNIFLANFANKGEILGFPSQQMSIFASILVVANFACLVVITITVAPELVEGIRYPLIASVRIISHVVVLGYPPLLYGCLQIAAVRDRNEHGGSTIVQLPSLIRRPLPVLYYL
jgi:hypothetical protein